MKEELKLNIGCGEMKLEGYTNVDLEETSKPDLVHDIRKGPLPFADGTVDHIQMFHSIEHIEMKFWNLILSDFHRVLKDDGTLFLAYPEFEKCSQYFLENHLGLRDLFRATLYGRQLYPGDYHVVPMVTPELIGILRHLGFHNFKSGPDPDEDWNSIVLCHKGSMPLVREDILRKEIFGLEKGQKVSRA